MLRKKLKMTKENNQNFLINKNITNNDATTLKP